MFVSNTQQFGHLINDDDFVVANRQNPDMWSMFENKPVNINELNETTNCKEWEARYLHPEFYSTLNSEQALSQPCPDVYDFPFVTKRWCQEMIKELEAFGRWSDGSTKVRT